MKQSVITLILALGAVSGWGQVITCHIKGTTTDTSTTKLYLIENGTTLETQSNVISIPVVDGKFNYTLKSDVIRYYELIPDNQYEKGSIMPAYFIAENQSVYITMDSENNKVITTGTGEETKMMQRCKDELDAIYDPLLNAIDAKRDSMDAIIPKEMEDMDAEQKSTYLINLWSDYSNNSYAYKRRQLDRNYRSILLDYRIASIKWLGKHPCIYGLFLIKDILSSSGDMAVQLAPTCISLYKNVYSNKYKGHPYHNSIQDAMKSMDLASGNKYIDYEITNLDGKQVKMSSLFTGKVIFIDLWASWCGPCRMRAKELIPIYEKYKNKGFQVIGIACEATEENMRQAITTDGYPWLNILEQNDKNHILLKHGGLGGFLIDSNGTILAVHPKTEETEKILKDKLGE